MSADMEKIVKARQVTADNVFDLWEWADSKPHYAAGGVVDGLTVWTPEGRAWAHFGDWVVQDRRGKFWRVAAADYHATSEDEFLLVDQEQPTTPARAVARCVCGRRIWDPKSLRVRRGSKCRRGLHTDRRRLRPPIPARRRDVTGQTDLLDEEETEEEGQERADDR